MVLHHPEISDSSGSVSSESGRFQRRPTLISLSISLTCITFQHRDYREHLWIQLQDRHQLQSVSSLSRLKMPGFPLRPRELTHRPPWLRPALFILHSRSQSCSHRWNDRYTSHNHPILRTGLESERSGLRHFVRA